MAEPYLVVIVAKNVMYLADPIKRNYHYCLLSQPQQDSLVSNTDIKRPVY